MRKRTFNASALKISVNKKDKLSELVDKFVSSRSTKKTPMKVLRYLAIKADEIMQEELKRINANYTQAEVKIIDIRTIGVQGDERTYCYPAEITLYNSKRFVWDGQEELLERLSNRITNEVRGINRVLYVIAKKD